MLRFCGRATVQFCSCLLLAALLVALAIPTLLSFGPLRLDFATAMIERRLNAGLAEWRTEIGGVSVAWEREMGDVVIELDDVTLFDPDGERLISAPRLQLGLHGPSVLRGRIAPTELRLEGADAVLTRTTEGRFRFAVLAADPGQARATAPDADRFDAFREVLDALAGDGAQDGLLAHFRTVLIRDMRIDYQDLMAEEVWSTDDALIVLQRRDGGLAASLHATVATSPGAAPTGVSLSGVRSADGRTVDVSASFANATTRAIVTQTPTLAALRAVEGGVGGALRGRLDLETGDLTRLEGEIDASSARLRFAPNERIALERFVAAFSFDPAADAVTLDRLALSARGVSAELRGSATLSRDGERVAGGVAELELVALSSTGEAGLFSEPIKRLRGAASVEISTRPLAISAPRLHLATDDVRLVGQGRVEMAEGGPNGVLRLETGPFPAVRLAQVWPLQAAPGAREWIARNIRGGRVDGAQAEITLSPQGPALDLTFRFSDVTSSYLKEMTPITGADGVGHVTLQRLEMALSAGVVDQSDAGFAPLRLEGSSVVIPDLDAPLPSAEIALQASGRLPAALALLDQPPLGFVSKLNLDPRAAEGAARVTAEMGFPLAKALLIGDVAVAAEAELRDFRVTLPQLGAPVSGRSAALTADTKRLQLTGVLALGDELLEVTWRETFAPADGSARSIADIRAERSADELIALGAPTAHVRGGRAGLTGKLTRIDGRPDRLEGSLDLTGLALAVEPLNWSKPAGAEASASFAVEFKPEGVEFSEMAVDLGTMSFRGDATLDADGALKRARFADVRAVGSHAELIEIAPLDDGRDDGWRVSANGPVLDLRGPMKALAGEGEASDPPVGRSQPIEVSLAFDRLRLTDATELSALQADGVLAASGEKTFSVAATAPGGAPISAAYDEGAEGGALRVSSPDAGKLLDGLGYLKGGVGGELTIEADIGQEGDAVGEARIDDIVLLEAPVLAQILSIGSLIGLVDILNSGGLTFSEVIAPFELRDGVLHVKEAAAMGPSMGLTLDGTFERETGAVDFTGSVSPAFAINGLFNEVPVLGQILTGGRGEGVIGVAYEVTGDASDPNVFVNPLSALAPGPFRRLFSRRASDDPLSQEEADAILNESLDR